MYVSVLKHTIGLMGTLVGTLFEAIKAEKSFAIPTAIIVKPIVNYTLR